MTVKFAVLTYRGFNVLEDWRMVFVPAFSVGVNLMFVFLLQKHAGDPYFSPNVGKNAFFHIMHDLVGTEAGVLVFTWLMYMKGRDATNARSEVKNL